MEVILLERIERLGQMGDVVNVKPGYARNYLLPKKKALRANEENRKYFENQRAQLEAVNLKHRQEAEAVAEKLDGLQCVIIRQAGGSGQLYGSVSSRDIVGTLFEAGFTVTRQQIMVHHNIKALGIYECRVALHPEVAVTVSINVARSEEEARSQLAEAMETKKKEAEEAKKGVTADTEKAGKKGKRKKSAKEEKSEGSRDSQQSEEAAGAGVAPSPEPSPGTSRDGGEETSSEPDATASPPEGDSRQGPGEEKTG